MATKRSCFRSSGGYDFPEYYVRENAITDRQRYKLTNYILTLQDEDERDRLLAELDEMTETEANEMLYEASRWR